MNSFHFVQNMNSLQSQCDEAQDQQLPAVLELIATMPLRKYLTTGL